MSVEERGEKFQSSIRKKEMKIKKRNCYGLLASASSAGNRRLHFILSYIVWPHVAFLDTACPENTRIRYALGLVEKEMIHNGEDENRNKQTERKTDADLKVGLPLILPR